MIKIPKIIRINSSILITILLYLIWNLLMNFLPHKEYAYVIQIIFGTLFFIISIILIIVQIKIWLSLLRKKIKSSARND